jgi:hypothetical protein
MRLNECRGVPVIKKGKMNGGGDGRGRIPAITHPLSTNRERSPKESPVV